MCSSTFICSLATVSIAYADEAISNASEESAQDVSFIYLTSNEQSLSDRQYVVVGFSEQPLSAELVLEDMGSGSSFTSPAVQTTSSGAALFELTFPSASQYRISCVRYRFEGDEQERELAPDSNMRSNEGAIDVRDDAADSGDDSPAVTSYALNSNDEVIESDFAGSLGGDDGPMLFSLDATRSADTNGDGVFTVVLDPGHGGYDSGATGNGLRESNLTLRIAQYCRNELSRYAKTKVYMTRDSDVFVGLEERAEYAKSVSADLFVSFHINSSPDSSAKGAEIWIPSPGTWYAAFNGLSESLAQEMLNKFADLGLVDRGTMWDYYYQNGKKLYYPDGSWADAFSVIRNCRAQGIMGILVEHGFISNRSDAAFLASDANLRELGLADAKTIINHYGLKLPQPLFGFSDVFDDTAHSQEIGWMAASGISEGYKDGTFRGSDAVTRQDMAAFLYRLAGSPEYTPSESDKKRFSDVSTSTSHAKEIWWLASTGISTGFPNGTFRGMAPVARQDMAALLKRFTALYLDGTANDFTPSAADTKRFNDVNNATEHAEDIWWLASTGISTGFPNGTYAPGKAVARQDMAAFLYRASNLPVFNPSAKDKAAFSDVNESTSHANDIWWMSSRGISTGFKDKTFKGTLSVARQDMAAFLYRLAGSPSYTPSKTDKTRFTDVTDATEHAKEIWWLASTGITSGYNDGTFHPMDSVARSDMAAFMHRYYNRFAQSGQFKNWTPSTSSKHRFTDVDASTPHAEDIWWLGAMGISTGFSDGTYVPGGAVARQDMAAFLHRLAIRAARTQEVSTYKIMGNSAATIQKMVRYYNTTGATYPSETYKPKGAATIQDFAAIVFEESKTENVKAEVVFCQAMKETAWLKFGGSVKADQCNFAGLGATGASVSGAVFSNVRTGIRAQVQHLKAYASTEALVNACVDPRFSYVQRGVAPTLAALNGRWAVPGSGYGQSIYAMIKKLESY